MNTDNLKLLWDENYERLLLFAYSLIKDEDTAKDVIQDSFIKLLGVEDGKYKDPRYLLYTMVRNQCLDIIRKIKRTQQLEKELMYINSTEQSEVIVFNGKTDLINIIYNEIENLPKKTRLVITEYLKVGNGPEVAANLKTTHHIVLTLKSYGIKLIKERLELKGIF